MLLEALASLFVTVAPDILCEPGTDCYCDRVKDSGSPIYDPNLIMCEDFEAPTLHVADAAEAVSTEGDGAPYYGAWHDWAGRECPGSNCTRGWNGYWRLVHQQSTEGAVDQCNVDEGTPVNPQVGFMCKDASGTSHCRVKEYHPADLWDTNDNAVCIDIIGQGEFDAERAGIDDPTVPNTSRSGVFDGRAVFGYRVGAGATAGIIGSNAIVPPATEIGITMAVAFPQDSVNSGIWDAPWKPPELNSELSNANDFFAFGHNESGLRTYTPIRITFKSPDSTSEADCDAAVAAADTRRGIFFCTPDAEASRFYVAADPAHYTQSVNWPFGEWGCIRAHYSGMGTSNFAVKVWHNETLVIDFDGFDGTLLFNQDGYDDYIWNAYSNANQGATPTTEVTYRYQDNIHLTRGVPPSCNQIGFEF